MTSYRQQILDQFEIVRRERDAAVRELSRAQETINILEAEVTAIKCHGDLAYAKVADEQGMSKRQIERKPEVKITNATAWIGDIWMCSLVKINILRPAEEAWAQNFTNPQQAILLATEALKTNLVKKERLRCKLFMAAIQFSAGSLEQACAMANECIRECGTDPRFKNVAGLACYIRGRIFMEMKLYSNAHWDFSMAVFTEGYHEHVKKWQGYCESRMLEEESEETAREDVESTSGDSNYCELPNDLTAGKEFSTFEKLERNRDANPNINSGFYKMSIRAGNIHYGGDDGVDSSPISPEIIHVSPRLLEPDSPIASGLRPLPLQARRSLSRGHAHAPPAGGRLPNEHDDGDPDDDRTTRNPFYTSEDSRLGSSDSEFEDFELTEAFRENLTEETIQYLKHSIIESIYGDFLSGSREVIYEPKWPAEFGHPEPALYKPASQEEANYKFRQLYEPLRGWHKLQGRVATAGTRSRLAQIMRPLMQYHQYRAAKQTSPEKRSGDCLLYRNLPDAALETNVWSLINAAHISIRRKEWVLADRGITKALFMAKTLRYEPLVAKCWYWRGIVADGLDDRGSAADCFLSAMRCVGVYQEGELMSKVIPQYKDDLLDLLDEQDAHQGESEFSTQARRVILGIDGYFRPLRSLALASISDSEDAASQQLSPKNISNDPAFLKLSPKHGPNEDISPLATTPESPSLPVEHIDNLLNELSGNDESDREPGTNIQPQNAEPTVAAKLEEVAQNAAYVPRETIYELCRELSLSFEQFIRAEVFTENFDNYPDVEETIAWKVLNYSKRKAGLGEPSDRKGFPKVDEGTTSDVKGDIVRSLPGSHRDHNSKITEREPNSQPGAKNGRPALMVNTGKVILPSLPVQTAADVFRTQLPRRDNTAEEKIAAYEQALINRDDGIIKNVKPIRAALVKEEMKKPGISDIGAHMRVDRKNREYFEKTWGPEGVMPPTPSPTRREREQDGKEWNEQCLKRFKAELTCMTYQRKHNAYMRLSTGRREQIAEPVKPASAIAWLEKLEKEQLAVAAALREQRGSAFVAYEDRASKEAPIVARDFASQNVEVKVDCESDIHMSPLRPHRQPAPISKSEPDRKPGILSEYTSNSSMGNIPSTISWNRYIELNTHQDASISTEVKAQIAIDAMSEAMEDARTSGLELDLEDLTQIAEAAVNGATNQESPNRIPLSAGENPSSEDIQEDGENPSKVGPVETSPDLMTFSSDEDSADTNESEDYDADAAIIPKVASFFTDSPEEMSPDYPSLVPAPNPHDINPGNNGGPEADEWEDEDDENPRAEHTALVMHRRLRLDDRTAVA